VKTQDAFQAMEWAAEKLKMVYSHRRAVENKMDALRSMGAAIRGAGG
jgi:hypothetical protein